MQKIINQNGYIQLINPNGNKILIGQIRHGITFNLFKSSPRKVTCVEFKHRNFTDTFYFCDETPVYHFLTSRDNIPELTQVYLSFFVDENKYTAEEFSRYVAKNYFVKQLGYQMPDENTPKKTIKTAQE